MSKEWVHGHGWECPACGCEIEIFTDAHEWAGKGDIREGAVFFCDDEARCPECPWRGGMYACEDDQGVSDGNLDDLHDCDACAGHGQIAAGGLWIACTACSGHGFVYVVAAA